MKHTILLFALLPLLPSPPSQSQDEELTARDLTERLQRRSDMIDDAIAGFEQHVTFGYSNIEQTFTGTLTFKKPNRYRIESEAQTIVTDGTTVWAYSAASKQVIIDRYKENQNSISPEQFLLNLPSAYYVSLLGGEKGAVGRTYQLKLVPKDDRSFVRSVKLWVEAGSWTIRKVLITDVNETETRYTVNNLKLNSNVREKEFTFTPPPDTEVVDLR